MDYYHKYLKYKSKYNKFKNNMNSQYNFYFIHTTKNMKNLKNILKEGYIKLGSDIPIKDKYLSGYENEPYIFSNIYFKDLDNLEWFNDLSLIIKPEIIDNQSILFIGGWGNFKISEINSFDSQEEKIIKLEKMKNFIINPTDLHEFVLKLPKYMQHEVKFTSPINIKKYLYGITIGYKNNNELKTKLSTIKKILLKYNLENIKIFSYNKKILC